MRLQEAINFFKRTPLFAGLAILSAVRSPDLALAASFAVDTTADSTDANPGDGICRDSSGRCSVRAAIEEANDLPGRDTISIPSGTHTLTLHTPLRITSGLYMNGAGKFSTRIDGDDKTQILILTEDIVVDVRSLRIQNARGPSTGSAAAVYVGPEVFARFNDVDIVDNYSGTLGGGIANFGTLYLTRVAVSRNTLPTAVGGGVTSQGGGILNAGGTLVLSRCEISDNVAIRGAGISSTSSDVNPGWVKIEHSTISGNIANGAGGGIRNVADSFMAINFSTITRNRANEIGISGEGDRYGGGIYNSKGEDGSRSARITIGNSIVAGNTDGRVMNQEGYGPDCYTEPSPSVDRWGILTRYDNIIGIKGDNCDIDFNTDKDQVGTPENPIDPMLDSILRLNGGLTRSHALLSGSPAIDADVHDSGLPRDSLENACVDPRNGRVDKDQRGQEKMIGGVCDIGAYEAQISTAFSVWTPEEPVEMGMMITYDGKGYEVTVPHTTLPGWEPPKVPALFIPVSLNVPGAPWAPGITYEVGDTVLYEGELYEVVQGHNSLESLAPPLSPTHFRAEDAGDPPNDIWEPDVTYGVGDVVLYGGDLYEVLLNHDSIASWTPPVSPTLFKLVPNMIDPRSPREPWAPGVDYEAGDTVLYDGDLYEVVMSHNSLPGWTPPVSPTLFTLVPEDPDGPGDPADPVPGWQAGISYAVGDEVVLDGTTYVAIQAHTSLVGWEPNNVPALWNEKLFL